MKIIESWFNIGGSNDTNIDLTNKGTFKQRMNFTNDMITNSVNKFLGEMVNNEEINNETESSLRTYATNTISFRRDKALSCRHINLIFL